MSTPLSFGDWIRQRRRRLDLTQNDLAERVGCSIALVRKLEAETRRPSRQIAEILAEALEIDPKERTLFLQVARSERAFDNLARITPPPEPAPFVPPPAAATKTPVAVEPVAAPPTRTAAHSLPVPTTPLIGRETELAAVCDLLRGPECRLLTVVGAGGMGKTRLALAAASVLRDDFAHGVAFVALAPLSAPDLIVEVTANAVGCSLSESDQPKRQLFGYLRTHEMVLVFDNFEHLLDGADFLIELLAAAPRVKLLATSREQLNLPGEWVFDLQGMPLPPRASGAPAGAAGGELLQNYSAIDLFVTSAQRVRTGFAITEENYGGVLHICQLVDGMPLAIELAAAWVHMLSCQEIAQEIERSIDFLTVSRRATPERQQSVRATLDHSWRLLAEGERRVLAQLSVFRGGFRREAATEVAGASLEVLAALVAKSLVHRNEKGRYDLHELVRQYAAARLEAGGLGRWPTPAETEQAHARYFCRLAEKIGVDAEIDNPGTPDLLEQAEQELPNLRRALEWSLATRAVETGLLIAGGLWFFWFARGHSHEGMTWLRQFLAPPVDENNQAVALARARAFVATGYLLVAQNALQEAYEILTEALALSDRHELRAASAWALCFLGHCANYQGDYPAAQHYLEQSMAIWRALGDHRRISWVRVALADNALMQEQYERATVLYEEMLAVHEGLEGRTHTLRRLARVRQLQGEYAQALALFRESLALNQSLSDQSGVVACIVGLCSCALAHQQLEHAAQLCGAVELLIESYRTVLIPYDRADYDQIVARTRQQLGETIFSAAQARGRAMTPEAAIRFAMTEPDVA
jgi:predicted ATPase/transcriptional regulator with XRE-family HTH domain